MNVCMCVCVCACVCMRNLYIIFLQFPLPLRMPNINKPFPLPSGLRYTAVPLVWFALGRGRRVRLYVLLPLVMKLVIGCYLNMRVCARSAALALRQMVRTSAGTTTPARLLSHASITSPSFYHRLVWHPKRLHRVLH